MDVEEYLKTNIEKCKNDIMYYEEQLENTRVLLIVLQKQQKELNKK